MLPELSEILKFRLMLGHQHEFPLRVFFLIVFAIGDRFGKLRRRELVDSVRGPGGGYCLARAAHEISVAEIIRAVDEPIDATQCGGKENCLGDGGRCMTHELWASLNQRMVEFLDSVTLQKLVDEQLAKGIQIEDKPAVKRAISSQPVVKPIRVNAPNSVFALGNVFAKS